MAGVVLAASGAYVFVYLYRREWNRAIIAGTFFLATEVALLGSAVLTRLRALDATGARARARAPRPHAAHRLHRGRHARPVIGNVIGIRNSR